MTDDGHRPWPRPQRPWIMAQQWHDLLFMHWPVEVGLLRALVPEPLVIDTYEGNAWLAVVPFHMSGIHLRGLPAVPRLSAFAELNVRTYVTLGGKAGVYFFSLDAADLFAVASARAWYHLPYYHATMRWVADGEWIDYTSRRTSGSPGPALRARYRPTGPVMDDPGPLARWLTERYCLYTVNSRGRPIRAEIHHALWPLQPAEAEVEHNSMLASLGLEVPSAEALLHFARHLEVVVWTPERLSL